jgi:hypothetical protein
LLLLTYLEPVFDKQNARIDHLLFPTRTDLQEFNCFFVCAESHNALDPGAVIPTPVKEDHLASRRKVWHVTLHIHLGSFPFGWRGQRHESEYPRADSVGDSLDNTTLSCGITAFENDDDLEALVLDPALGLHELRLQFGQLLFEVFILQPGLLFIGIDGSSLFVFVASRFRGQGLAPPFFGLLSLFLGCDDRREVVF